jgi:hypothetical protein
MEDRYGWTLLRIEPTGDKILKWNCVFEGKTEFPTYIEDSQMSRKYIIFRADWKEESGAESRQLAHTGAITDILSNILTLALAQYLNLAIGQESFIELNNLLTHVSLMLVPTVELVIGRS